MEFVDEDVLTPLPTKPLPKNKHRFQKGRWKHQPKGARRTSRHKLAQNKDKTKRANFRKRNYKPTKWKEENKWDSEYLWESLLDYNYYQVFEQICNKYSYYFDVVRGDLDDCKNEDFTFM